MMWIQRIVLVVMVILSISMSIPSVVSADENWTQVTQHAPWTPRWQHSSVVMPDGSIILMGGIGRSITSVPYNDTWRSTDNGLTWTLMNASSGWIGRYGHTSVVMPDSSIVLMGGLGNSLLWNDTWRSTDYGATWTQMNANAEWSARYTHNSVVLPNGNILLFGGYPNNNDVWLSSDSGYSWTEITEQAPWVGRTNPSSVIMPNGSVVLMGGEAATGYRNDVWQSVNGGVNWSVINQHPEWRPRASFTGVALSDSSIVIMGGFCNDGIRRNDTWRSNDNGITWTLINASSGWVGRNSHTSVVLPDDSIILMGGKISTYPYVLNDVWRFRPSVPPVYANFTATPLTGTVPLDVQFTDTSTGSPISWSWDFGDNLTSTDQNPSHRYINVSNGPYSVKLTVNDANGQNTTVKANYVSLVVPTQTSTVVPTTGPTQVPQSTYKMYAEVGSYSTTGSAQGFWETMNGASNGNITWTWARKVIANKTGGCLYEDCSKASHWTTDAPQWINQADFLFFSGHGARSSLWFQDDNGILVNAVEMGLDNTDSKTKWVVFDSCDTMYNGPDPAYDFAYKRWLPKFTNGLHMLLGWHSNADYQSNSATEYRGKVFAQLMQGAHTIREAWYLTGLDNYAAYQWSVSHDTWNAVMYWDECKDDKLPGWGIYCTNPGSSGLITWEPRFIAAQDDYATTGSSSRTVNLAGNTYSLTASVPVIDDEVTIYKPVKSGYTKEDVSSLTKNLGISGNLRETDNGFNAGESDAKQFLLSVEKNPPMIVFRNNNLNATRSGTKQSDAQAISAADAFLRKNYLMPSGVKPRVANNTIVTFTPSGTVVREQNVNVVIYPQMIDGIPVSGAQFNVEVDSDGNVIGLFRNWRDYEPVGKVTLKSPEEAFGELEARQQKSKSMNQEKVEITGVLLRYSLQTSADGEEYLQPVYVFEGNNQRGNSNEPFEPVTINAKKEKAGEEKPILTPTPIPKIKNPDNRTQNETPVVTTGIITVQNNTIPFFSDSRSPENQTSPLKENDSIIDSRNVITNIIVNSTELKSEMKFNESTSGNTTIENNSGV